jgi:hypothetical protein
MMNIMKLVVMLVITFLPAVSSADDDEFFKNLVSGNVSSTKFSALVKTVSVDPVQDIRADSGVTGYITYKFIAEVKQVFKGERFSQIEYYLTYEAGIKPVISNKQQIISLCFTKDKKLYVPDGGYRIDATDELIKIAKQAADKNPDSTAYNPCR